MSNSDILAAREWAQKVLAQLAPRLETCTLPIFALQDDAPIQCGTGTLFAVADHSFLTTARHIADLPVEHKLDLYICDRSSGSRPWHLHGNAHLAIEDKYDVALWRLPKAISEDLASHSFLRLSDIHWREGPLRQGVFLWHGYPSCWSLTDRQRERVSVKPFTYLSCLYKGRADNFEHYDPKTHILLQYHSEEDGNTALNRGTVSMPQELQGISGCSIWQVHKRGDDPGAWGPDDAKIVAIQTGLQKSGSVVKGTRWWVIYRILREKYPQLRDPMRMHE